MYNTFRRVNGQIISWYRSLEYDYLYVQSTNCRKNYTRHKHSSFESGLKNLMLKVVYCF